MSQSDSRCNEGADPGRRADECARRGFHQFVMGLVGCRVCGAPGPGDEKPLIVTPFAHDDPDHTAEGCARKFSEVRPLFASDRDPGDEHRDPTTRRTITCGECGETVYHFHYSPRSFDAELWQIIENLEQKMRSRPVKPFALPMFATGGSMVVGTAQEALPAGSAVSLDVSSGRMFRLTPGETIHVRTPAQVRATRRPWYRRLWSWLTGRRR